MLTRVLALSIFAGFALGLSPLTGSELLAADKPFKVLVVMSYEKEYPWVPQLLKGIRQGLQSTSEIRIVYLDTKRDLAGGKAKAEQAYQLYLSWKPDGVIACDDNAQALFVGPFLKNKVSTPIMFCGVNCSPGKYEYPADNISGILEKAHLRQTIAYASQIDPRIQSFGVLIKAGKTGSGYLEQIEKEKASYPAKLTVTTFPKNVDTALAAVKELRQTTDMLIIGTVSGLKDASGRPLTEEELIPLLTTIYGKPTATTLKSRVRSGVLCGVVQSGLEQGEVAAKKLLQAMRGTPVGKIPISLNEKGRKVLNLDELHRLGLQPSPAALVGVELLYRPTALSPAAREASP